MIYNHPLYNIGDKLVVFGVGGSPICTIVSILDADLHEYMVRRLDVYLTLHANEHPRIIRVKDITDIEVLLWSLE